MASASLAAASEYFSLKSAVNPAAQARLKSLSRPGTTPVFSTNLRTSRAGIRKLKPCTMEPPCGEREMNVSTPMTVASSVMAGPPLLPWEAAASVWTRS